MARHMKPINRGPGFAQGYSEASSADENGFCFAREASNALSLQYRSPLVH
jgi:hypothetical protein